MYNKLLAATAIAIGLSAGGVSAEVLDVTPFGSSRTQFSGGVRVDAPGTGTGVHQDGAGSGAQYLSRFNETPTSITFEAGSSSSGPFVQNFAISGMDIQVRNGEDSAVPFSLQSAITPAGFGFYLADRGYQPTPGAAPCGGNIFGACPQYGFTDIGLTDLTNNRDLDGIQLAFASAAFDFKVLDVTDSTLRPTVLYSISGRVLMELDPTTGLTKLDVAFSPLAQQDMPSIRLATSAGNPGAYGWQWDASPITVDLKRQLAPGEIRTVRYVSTVTTYSNALCLLGDTLCLNAYAGFGDPLVRTSGTRPSLAAEDDTFAAFASFLAGPAPIDPDALVTGLNFDPVTFFRPRFEKGVLTFAPTPTVVPEPSIWLTMILGLGAVGAALRRRAAALA